MGELTIGPLSFSFRLLTTFAAILAVMVVGNRAGRARGLDIERKLWVVVGLALLAARAVYVIRFADMYFSSPLSVIDIRDGGFSRGSGLLAGAAAAAWFAWRDKQLRIPMLGAATAGAGVFALVAIVMFARPEPTLRLPELALARLDGGTLALASLAGKPVVVNVWASWCPPCRREMPALRQAQLAHPEITFVFVNQAEAKAVVNGYLGQQGLMLDNVLLDPGQQMPRLLGSKGLPTTFFFDRKGIMRGRRGGELSAATLAEQLALIHLPHQ